jgi:hypothetical protein
METHERGCVGRANEGFFTVFFFAHSLFFLVSPSAAFHVYELGYNLYAEGGGLYAALTSGCLAFLYTLALAVGLTYR